MIKVVSVTRKGPYPMYNADFPDEDRRLTPVYLHDMLDEREVEYIDAGPKALGAQVKTKTVRGHDTVREKEYEWEIIRDPDHARGASLTTAHSPLSGSGVRITSPFGWRLWNGVKQFHTGTDITSSDRKVVATEQGRVVFAGEERNDGWGQKVIICHQGVTSMSAHLASITVKVGDTVQQGQVIGEYGNTGLSTGAHLHYEERAVLITDWQRDKGRWYSAQPIATSQVRGQKSLQTQGEQGRDTRPTGERSQSKAGATEYIIVAIAAVVLIGAVIWYFTGLRHGS